MVDTADNQIKSWTGLDLHFATDPLMRIAKDIQYVWVLFWVEIANLSLSPFLIIGYPIVVAQLFGGDLDYSIRKNMDG